MWVVVALVVIVALAALVLSIPVDLGARVEVHGRPVAHFRVEWLFVKVSKAVRVGGGVGKPRAGPPPVKEPSPTKEQRKKKDGRAGRFAGANARLAWELVTLPGLLRSIVRMAVRLLRRIEVRVLSVDFAADLGDPADTAMFSGAFSQAAMFADLWSPYSFRLVPAFGAPAPLDGEAEIAVRMRPISMLTPVLGFVLAPSTLKAIVLVVRSRWTKNDG